MSDNQLPVLAQRTLPAASHLHPSSCCPTRDLAALTSVSTPGASTDAKLSLWRTTGSADLVWEWSPPPPPAPPPRPGALFKGKAKASAGEIEQLTWNPDGNFLAVALRSPSAAYPSTSPHTLNLLSLHSGTSPLPPISLPASSSSTSATRITHLSWQPLHHPTDPLLTSRATETISSLPTLPVVSAASKAPLAGAPTGGPGAGVASGQGGVFGAKNAMLQREREKEMGRALEMQVSAPSFPTLLPIDETDGKKESEKRKKGEAVQASVLLVGTDEGSVHLYLGGTVLLGTVKLEEGARVLGLTVLPSSSSTTRISVLLSSPQQDPSASTLALKTRSFALSLPPSLELFTQTASLLRSHVSHAFETLQEARALWDESRRIGKAWLARLGELSKGHGVTQTPISQLLLLLLTGRPTRSLHDFLASKMNEKALNKWETSTAAALEKLKDVGFMSVQTAMERVVLGLEELLGWSKWPEKFGAFALQAQWILQSLEVAKEVIRSSVRMEREALEEERCFTAFGGWLRYELEKVAALEGSEVRPLAKFQPIPVAHFISNCLDPDASSLSPYLNFGLLNASLATNAELLSATEWLDGLHFDAYGALLPSSSSASGAETLEAMLRRMKEELKGQADAEILEAAASTTSASRIPRPPATPFAAAPPAPASAPRPPIGALERPQRPDKSSSLSTAPTSLPVMLHLLAGRLAKGLDESIQRVGEGAVVGDAVQLGELEAEGRAMVRGRVVHEPVEGASEGEARLYEAWIGGGVLWMTRRAGRSDREGTDVEKAGVMLRTERGDGLEVVEWDFFDDSELMMAVKAVGKDGVRYALVAVELSSFSFSSNRASDSPPSPHLSPSRSHNFDPHFPPQGLALNGRAGRRVACSLAGEGRKLDILDAEVDEAEGDETMDV